MPFDLKTFQKSITYEDYEESVLLANYASIVSRAENRLYDRDVNKTKLSPSGRTPEDVKELKKLQDKLGYDPSVGRGARPRGRARRESLPNPLPDIGTELLSCIGDIYVVVAYAYLPRSGDSPSVILYRDKTTGRLISRGISNLFAGQLASAEPIVTWPTDPRKLKPGQHVPLNKMRRLTKAELQGDSHYDPDKQPLSEAEKRRRY